MSLSFKQLNEKAIAKKGITLSTPETRFRHFQDLIELVANMDITRSSSGSTCSGHVAKSGLDNSFATIDNALTSMKSCTCHVHNATDSDASGTPSCSCNLRTACTCVSRTFEYSYYSSNCVTRTACECNSRDQTVYCSCHVLTPACYINAFPNCLCNDVCMCEGRTSQPACACNTDDIAANCSCNLKCLCNARTSSCACNTRCSCNLRTSSNCGCNIDDWGAGLCTCVSRTATGQSDSTYYVPQWDPYYVCNCVNRTFEPVNGYTYTNCECASRTGGCSSQTYYYTSSDTVCSSRTACSCHTQQVYASYTDCENNVGCLCQSVSTCGCNTRCSCNSVKIFA